MIVFLSGELPITVVKLFSAMRRKNLGLLIDDIGPGFTLPSKMGDWDPSLTTLDLRGCKLLGKGKQQIGCNDFSSPLIDIGDI